MEDNCILPETVEYKSCTATIYIQRNRNTVRYEVRYYDVDGSRQRVTFPTYPSAKKFAETAVKELAANREQFVTLRGREAFDSQTALETLRPLGLSIAQAATLIAEPHRQLNGQGSVQDAVKYYLENRPQRSPDITVRKCRRPKECTAISGPQFAEGRRLHIGKRASEGAIASPYESRIPKPGFCGPDGSAPGL